MELILVLGLGAMAGYLLGYQMGLRDVRDEFLLQISRAFNSLPEEKKKEVDQALSVLADALKKLKGVEK